MKVIAQVHASYREHECVWLVEMSANEVASASGLSVRAIHVGATASVSALFDMLDQARRKLAHLQEVSRDLEAIASLLSGVRTKAEQSLLPQKEGQQKPVEAQP